MGDKRPDRSVHRPVARPVARSARGGAVRSQSGAVDAVAVVGSVRDDGWVSFTGMPRFRKFWSTVQVAVLSAAVLFCIVMLVIGQGKLDRVYAVAAIFFGLALAGHATYLWLTARAARSGR